MLSCRRCGGDTYGSQTICSRCLQDWSAMRKQAWDFIGKKLGKLSPENLKNYQKEMKRLEAVWREDKDKFQEMIKGVK